VSWLGKHPRRAPLSLDVRGRDVQRSLPTFKHERKSVLVRRHRHHRRSLEVATAAGRLEALLAQLRCDIRRGFLRARRRREPPRECVGGQERHVLFRGSCGDESESVLEVRPRLDSSSRAASAVETGNGDRNDECAIAAPRITDWLAYGPRRVPDARDMEPSRRTWAEIVGLWFRVASGRSLRASS
jgi:hypothetical protein